MDERELDIAKRLAKILHETGHGATSERPSLAPEPEPPTARELLLRIAVALENLETGFRHYRKWLWDTRPE